MLLVSHWTIHRRVSEFGLTHLSHFSDITDEQLDSKVSAFLNEHGCLVGTSMVLGHLRSEGLNIQREWVCKCLARVYPCNRDFKIWYGEAVVQRQMVKITSGDVMTRVPLRLSHRSLAFYYGKVPCFTYSSLHEHKLAVYFSF